MSTALFMTRGTTKSFSITATDAGDPLDISTATLEWTAKHEPFDPAVITKSTADGITVTDGPGGLATLTIDPADTADFVDMTVRLVWELEMTQAGETKTLAQGTIDVEPDVA